MQKIKDYKIIETQTPAQMHDLVLDYSKKGYVLNGPLKVQGEYQYTSYVQGMVLYEEEDTAEEVIQIHTYTYTIGNEPHFRTLGLTNKGNVVWYNSDKDKWERHIRALSIQEK